MKIEKLYRILLIRFLFVLTIIFFQFADGQTIENVLTFTNLDFALDNFQEKEIVRLSVPEGITTVEVEITLPLGVEYAEGTAVITKGEAKIIQKTGTLLSQPTFVVTINKGNTITFEFNRKVTSQALFLKGELKDTVRLKVGERLYDTKLSNSYYLRSPSLLLQPSPIVFDKKDGKHNDFFVLSNTGIGGVKDIYFSVDYPEEVSLIDLKYKGEKMLPIGVVPAGYANAGAPLYRVGGTFFNKKKDRIIIYEHYTVANCQSNCPIKYATYWGDNKLYFYETKEEIKLLHPKKEPTIITLSDDTYTVTTTASTTTTATIVGSVFSNDRLNGKPIDIQKVIFSLLPQSTPNTFIITKDGNIIVPAQIPIGRYTLNYRICDNSQPSKNKNFKPICQTATVTITILQSVTTPTTATSTIVTTTTTPTVVTPTIITLSDDTYTLTTTESTTTTATTVGSVFTNDRMNGKTIDIKKVIFSLLPQSTPNTFVITKEGNIIVPAQTSIGRYTLNYRICDNSQPLKNKSLKPICQTATVTIAVLQSVTTPTTTTSTTVTTTTPTVITLLDDTYTVTTTESTTTTATTVGSVFINDHINGKPIDIQKVIFSLLPQSTPTSFVITKDGNIIVPAHTPIGRYTLNYRICDNSQTLKDKSLKPICKTATVTIAVLQSVTTPTTTTSTTITATTSTVVTPTVITLSDDTYTLTITESSTTTATTVGSVFNNDRMNGKPIDIQKVIFSLLPQSTSTSFVITKDGNIIVPSQIPIGHYTLNYRICDNSQPSKNKNFKPVCQTATVTIVVRQTVTTPTTTTSTTVTATTTATVVTPTVITLSDDTYTLTTTESTTTTATTVGSVFINDRLNGKPINIQKVIFSLLPQSTPTSFVITKDGNIIVPSHTPIGCYTLNYRICDNSQNSKDKSFKPICQTATVTIVVRQTVTTSTTTTSTTVTTTTTPTVVSPTVITLSDDTYTLTTTESTTTTATTVGSVFINDRLNGKSINIQKVIFSLLPQSTPTSFVITKDGNIIVPAQTPIGHYTLNYRICDNSQSLKDKNLKPICQTATVTIAILQSVTTSTVITLSDDTYTLTTTESTTTTATTVGSVFANDRLNGKPIDIQKVIFSLLSQSTPTSFVITKDGNIIVPAQTPAGRYTLNYRICDNSQTLKNKNHKPICQTAIVTIVILQSVTTPTTATNTTVTATTTPTIITPTVITLSDDTYTVTTTESTTTTATTVGSVLANDRLNGKPIDIQKVIFSLLPQSTPNTFIITKDGNIIVPAQTPIGHYTLNYRICDNSQPSKEKSFKPICQTATVTIVVRQTVTTPTTTTSTTVIATTTPTVITLSDDTYTVTTTESTTTTATTVGSVFTNDRLNGKPIDIQKVIFSLLPQSTPTSFVITKDGNIIVPAHTPIGRYTLNYRICLKDKSFKPIYQTATVTIVVRQTVTTPTTTTGTTVTATTTTPTVITLSDDTYIITTTESTTTTATTVGSVFTNDRLNGKPINIKKVIFSLLPQSTPNTFIITKDGNIIVPAQTPIGNYTLNYRICDNSQNSKEKNQKTICQTATVTIVVLQSVTTPTTTTSTTVTVTTTPTIVTPTVITLSDDTYTLTTTHSTTTIATTVGSVFTNDRLNGKPINIQKVIFSLLPQSTSTSFVITKDGNIIVPAHTPIERYTLNYRICDNSQSSKEKSFKPICQTATVTIVVRQTVTTPTTTTSTTVTATTTPTVVTPTVITLSDDTYTLTTTESTTTTATTVGSVFTNDRLNEKPIDIQKVIFSLLPQSTPNTFVITKDGNIIVPPHTSIGHYTLNYRICDNSQTSKDNNFKPICQTATVTIAILQSVTTPTTSTTVTTTTTATVVTPTVITLSDDTYTITTTESVTTTATTVGSVFTNDRLNGKPIDIQKVIFSLLPQSTPTSFVITKANNIIVPPHTPIGRYTLNYRICDNSQTLKDKSLKPVCQTATVTIVVLQSVTTPTTATNTTVTATTTPTIITLSDDTYTITTTESATTTATTVGSVFTNDRLNGKTIDIQKVIFSLLPQSAPNNGFVITKGGNIIVPAQTPIGPYTLNYRICDNSQPLKNKSFKLVCQTATVTIAVLQSVTTPTINTPTTTTSTTLTTTTTPTVVTPTVITLSDDTYTITTTKSTTTTATTVGSVFTNDRLNGKPIDIQKVIFSLLPQSTSTSFVITKDGNIIVPAQTPAGRYTLNYRICNNSQPSKSKNQKPICKTATVTIAVLQSVTTPTTTTSTTVTATTTPTVVTPTVITLSDDTYTLTTTESTTTTATTVGSVFTNDRLNGKSINIKKVIFSLLPQSTPNTFIITKDGNIIVPPHTPIGRYTLNYRICDNSQILKDKSLKPICQTATVTIAILQSVTTPTTTTNTTTSTTVTATTTATVVTPTIITLSDDTYTVTTTESTTTTATTVGSVFTNDRLNGKPIDIQKVIFSLLPQSTPNTFIITKDGNIIVPAHTPIGRYTLNYRICDNSQPSKNKNFKPVCQTATVTIAILQSVTTPTTNTPTTTTSTTLTTTTTPTVVTPTVITLSDNTYTVTTTESTTTTATTVGSVFTNDRLNGKPIDIQKVIFSLLPQSTPNTFIITKDGNIIVPPQTPIGRYILNYRICDNSQPSKNKSQKPICQTATVTIAILQSVTTPTTITLSNDTYTLTTTESATTTATTVGSVFTNDHINGKPIDIQKVIFSLLPQSTPNTFIITKDGNIIVPAQTPIGYYTLNYRICDSKNKNQKKVCQTATITITILQTPVTPTVSTTVETATSSTTQNTNNQPIAVSDSVTTPMNTPIHIAVLDNDTPYTASPKIVIFPTNGDAFVKEDNTILYRPRVRFIGTDYFVYELCTPSSQSCTTATVTVKVTHKVVADNAMSANGDDKNDYFHIIGIENYPDNQVTIYNRNGEKVFTISHYDNRQKVFKGIVEGEVSLSNTAYLPQDTYFYLIEYYDETRQLQRQIGWLYLKR